MKSIIFTLILCPLALAQNYYNANGSYGGRAVPGPNGSTSYYGPNGNTSYYGANGAYQGRSQSDHRGNTSYYGANGAYQGSSRR